MPPPLPRTTEIVQQGIAAGLHIGAQLYVSFDSAPIANLAIGQSRPGVPMTPDTIMPWLSAGKPVTAVAIAQLFEQHQLDYDDPVAKYIPEFATHGKEVITIKHLLTHTAGIRFLDTGYPSTPWDQIIQKISAMRIEPRWEVGKSAGYHIATSWFIFGEIIQRITSQFVDDYIHENIFRPLSMADAHVTLTPAQYQAYGDRIGIMQNTQPSPPISAGIDTEQRAAAPNPGAGLRGPAHQLARFYESLLNDNPQILFHDTARLFTTRRRVGQFDQTFKHVMDWAFGFIVNTTPEAPYSFGPYASQETFGHGGNQSAVGMADPQHKLVVTLIFNGMPGEPNHQARLRQTLAAIYKDIGLA